MPIANPLRRAALAACALLLLALAASPAPCQGSALSDFVHAPDPEYAWHDTGYRVNGSGWRAVLLNLTSQAWLNESEVSPSVWTHQLLVVVPDNLLNTSHALIWITGGHNEAGPPSKKQEDLIVASKAAVAGGTIAVSLYQVPNQPLQFANDGSNGPRTESTLLPFSFRRFLNDTSRPELCILLPMVKSAVRAMDAVTEYAAGAGLGNITAWTVTGASKRGWTTWLTGAVDPRVAAIAPVVFDMLNFDANILHQYRLLGGWSFVLASYWSFDLTRDFGNPEVIRPLAELIDPMTYKEALTMPKLVIDAVGDEFFMIDDDRFWWGQLRGPTYRLMVQNAEHSMATGITEALGGMAAFHQAVWRGEPVPRVDWVMDPSGPIHMTTHTKPKRVTLYSATTIDKHRRDFRLVTGDTPANPCHGRGVSIKLFGGKACLTPLVWWGADAKPGSGSANGTYSYTADLPAPSHGFRGFFFETTFPGPGGTEFRLSTQVSIVPDVYPFPPCRNTTAGCEGVLV